MELSNEFRVSVPIEEAWAVLTDVERITPCMPGAQLTEVEGDDYKGTVKVKVGPISVQYSGAASFTEKDDDKHRAVLNAEGRDTRGQGNANAVVTAELTADGDGTNVVVTTDLKVTGKVAQFGRGVMADVSAKLLGQFVDCIENELLAGDAEDPEPEAVAAEVAPSEGPRRIEMPEPEPVDLLQTAGAPVAKRALPVVVLVLVVLLLMRRRRRRSKISSFVV